MPMSAEVSAASAGVSLYKRAQELEQLSRTPEDRKKNGKQISTIKAQLADPRFVTGFGSIGGEEFFSYLNISDSLHRAGGPEWERWNSDMKAKILKMQNEDGTWAGHHCITGRVAVTSAAILMLVADRENLLTSALNTSVATLYITIAARAGRLRADRAAPSGAGCRVPVEPAGR